jgi:hypothetical protein
MYRYVGLTTKTAQVRLRQHFKVAAEGRKTPFYDWLRKQDRDNVIVDPLDWADGLDELGEAEIAWIVLLRQEGHSLLNLADGGLGPTGVEWTAEMREAARIRSTGRKGLSRFAEDNPFYGRNHSPEQRAKWSKFRARESQLRKVRRGSPQLRPCHVGTSSGEIGCGTTRPWQSELWPSG